jgi:hypothetical protein
MVGQSNNLVHVLVEEGDEKRKRYGHAASAWKGMLVVVGGSKHYNKFSGRRDCLNDVLIYNPSCSQCSGAMVSVELYLSIEDIM